MRREGQRRLGRAAFGPLVWAVVLGLTMASASRVGAICEYYENGVCNDSMGSLMCDPNPGDPCFGAYSTNMYYCCCTHFNDDGCCQYECRSFFCGAYGGKDGCETMTETINGVWTGGTGWQCAVSGPTVNYCTYYP